MSNSSDPSEDDPQALGEPGATAPRGLEDAEGDVAADATPEPTEQPSGDPDRPSNPS